MSCIVQTNKGSICWVNNILIKILNRYSSATLCFSLRSNCLLIYQWVGRESGFLLQRGRRGVGVGIKAHPRWLINSSGRYKYLFPSHQQNERLCLSVCVCACVRVCVLMERERGWVSTEVSEHVCIMYFNSQLIWITNTFFLLLQYHLPTNKLGQRKR